MGSGEYGEPICEVLVGLPCDTPVVGCEINPHVRVKTRGPCPKYSLSFSWYREWSTCSIHPFKLATTQCTSCINLKLPIQQSYHCSSKCFFNAWRNHVVRHHDAAQTVSQTADPVQQAGRKLRSSGSWPDFGKASFSKEDIEMVEREGKVWIKVGSSKTYEPSMDDVGLNLRLESVATDGSTSTNLSPVNITVTDPVITFPPRCPRCMIQTSSSPKSGNIYLKGQSEDFTFRVLSYNILSDLYTNKSMYNYCPPWALVWEYRRKNLLDEIIEYDADILCLQEVQSDHFENFLKPQLAKHGYSVMFKRKSNQVYTANKYTVDGCATFYRHDVFREIKRYELEFDKAAKSVINLLEPGLRSEGSSRLLKDNVALVVVLEALRKQSGDKAFRPRICVANTHIHANASYPDVKMYQVAKLVHGLEKIAQSQVPILICGDLNCLPGSDPHTFLARGVLDFRSNKEPDPLGIRRILKLQHSMSLVSAYSSIFHAENIEERQFRRINPENYEPRYTHFTPAFSGTLDYIFYTADSLRVESVLELVDPESVGVGLPSPIWSSDHIALMASFTLECPCKWKSRPLPLPARIW